MPRTVMDVMDRSPHGGRLLLTAYSLQICRVHYLLPRTCSRHILAGVTTAGFLMVKKMLYEHYYCG